MKIFINARFLSQPLSGVQRYGIECSRQIKKLHPDVVFLTPKNILYADIAQELGAEIIGVNTGHLWEQTDLPLYMAKQRHQPLLNFANTAPLLYSNNYLTIHDLAFYHHPEWNSKMFSAWYNILVPRLAYGSKHLFTVSYTMAGELVKYYGVPPAKISVTYNGISQRMIDAKPTAPIAKERIILSVGSFNTRKNHQKLIAAYLDSSVKDDYQLVIVGDKNKVFSETGIDEATLAGSNIKIHQRFTENELIELYHRAEVVVSLSAYEGFGIPLLEGLYNGCRIICSDIPVYRELYDGLADFCNPDDMDSVCGALNAIANKNTILGEKKELAMLLEKYNYARSAQVILDRIQGVVK